MLLAGDIGGTTTRLGLFEAETPRPRPSVVRAFTTRDYPDLSAVISAFALDAGLTNVAVEAACFGVAGPVAHRGRDGEGGRATLTSVPWRVEAAAIASRFDIPRVSLLNDLEAMGMAIPLLEDRELHALQPGEADPDGNVALIAAGTGLGFAQLHRVGGRWAPTASEGGHADFAPRNEREIAVLRDLIQRVGRAQVEDVVSGRGLVNLHRVTHASPCAVVEVDDTGATDPSWPAAISAAAAERRCQGCMDALDLFVDAYGAEAGNWALRTVSTGGVFVGGGIAPRILPALAAGRFMRAFLDKPPLSALLGRMPVNVILNDLAALVGAAAHAAEDSVR